MRIYQEANLIPHLVIPLREELLERRRFLALPDDVDVGGLVTRDRVRCEILLKYNRSCIGLNGQRTLAVLSAASFSARSAPDPTHT